MNVVVIATNSLIQRYSKLTFHHFQMGLDILVGRDLGLKNQRKIWKGSYTAFAWFRGMIGLLHGLHSYAKLFGINRPVQGFDEPKHQELAQAEFRRLYARRPELECFFSHSDTEGIWTPEECAVISAMLRDVRDKLPLEEHWGHIGNWQETLDRFITGLDVCVGNHINAVFC